MISIGENVPTEVIAEAFRAIADAIESPVWLEDEKKVYLCVDAYGEDFAVVMKVSANLFHAYIVQDSEPFSFWDFCNLVVFKD